MALKFSSKAKAVRIRIKSGGEEHSTLGTLCENFCVADILEIFADGRLDRWLENQSDNSDSNHSKSLKTKDGIVASVKAFKNKYEKFTQTGSEWKQVCGKEEVKTDLIKCFFLVDNKSKHLYDIIQWFNENGLKTNANLTINEGLIENNPEWAVWVRKNLPFTPQKGWIEIFKKFRENGEALWLLHKEYKKTGESLLAIKTAKKAIEKGYNGKIGKDLSDAGLEAAKKELNNEPDDDILKAYIMFREEPITEENLLKDFGFAKYQIKYAGSNFPKDIDKEEIMRHHTNGLLWYEKFKEGERPKNNPDRTNNVQAKYIDTTDNKSKDTNFDIPKTEIHQFLLSLKFPDFEKHISNKDIRNQIETLFRIFKTILNDTDFTRHQFLNKDGMKRIIGKALILSNGSQKWISVEIAFLRALQGWFGYEDKKDAYIVFKQLAEQNNYKPAIEIFNGQCVYNPDWKNLKNPYLFGNGKMSKEELKWILNTNHFMWSYKYLYEMIVYFIAHFVEYRKNQYEDVE